MQHCMALFGAMPVSAELPRRCRHMPPGRCMHAITLGLQQSRAYVEGFCLSVQLP